MKTFVLFVFSLFLCAASAADTDAKLVQPKGSTLRLKALQTHDGLSANFTGEMWVTGTLIAEWSAGTSTEAYKTPDYVLVPDAKSIKKLPYFTIKDAPHFLRYPVTTIEVENGAHAIKLAAGVEKSELLFKGQIKRLKVTGSFLLEKYSVGVECDASWARASIQKVDIPDPARVARIETPEGC